MQESSFSPMLWLGLAWSLIQNWISVLTAPESRLTFSRVSLHIGVFLSLATFSLEKEFDKPDETRGNSPRFDLNLHLQTVRLVQSIRVADQVEETNCQENSHAETLNKQLGKVFGSNSSY